MMWRVNTVNLHVVQGSTVCIKSMDLLELTPPKICPFHYSGLECKSRKSRNTWNNRQIGLGIRNEAGQRLIAFCQENTLVIAKTLFHNTREDTTHGHHQMVNTKIRLIIFFAAKDGEARK